MLTVIADLMDLSSLHGKLWWSEILPTTNASPFMKIDEGSYYGAPDGQLSPDLRTGFTLVCRGEPGNDARNQGGLKWFLTDRTNVIFEEHLIVVEWKFTGQESTETITGKAHFSCENCKSRFEMPSARSTYGRTDGL